MFQFDCLAGDNDPIMRDETLCEGKLEVATQQRIVTDTILLPAITGTVQTGQDWEHVWGVFPQNLFTPTSHHYMVSIIIISPGVQSGNLTCEISPSFVPNPVVMTGLTLSVLCISDLTGYCSVKIRYYLLSVRTCFRLIKKSPTNVHFTPQTGKCEACTECDQRTQTEDVWEVSVEHWSPHTHTRHQLQHLTLGIISLSFTGLVSPSLWSDVD